MTISQSKVLWLFQDLKSFIRSRNVPDLDVSKALQEKPRGKSTSDMLLADLDEGSAFGDDDEIRMQVKRPLATAVSPRFSGRF